MHKVPDLFAVMQQIVRQAVAIPPRAPRGSLILREGDRFVARALVGFDAPHGPPADAGLASEIVPLAPEVAPESARGVYVVDARAWYRAHLPFAIEKDLAVPAGTGVLVAPIYLREELFGYLAIEQATMEAPQEDRRAMIEILAEAASDALERDRLYDEKARSAQELRLLEQLLNAVGTRVEARRLIETIAHGIKGVQLDPCWKTVELWLLDDTSDGTSTAPARGELRARVYRAPQSAPTTYFQNIREGAVNAGRRLGVTVNFQAGYGQGAGAQSDLLDEGIRRRVHGIIIAPIAPDTLEEGFRRAAGVGIPVIVIDTPPIPGSRAPLYIGTDNVGAGRLAGEMMMRLLPDGGGVAVLGPMGIALNARERLEGFRAAIEGSKITVLPPIECDYNQDAGTRLAMAALKERPDIAGAFGAAADNGLSWGLAARDAGKGGELKIVGFDLISSTLALLRKGVIHATIVQREYDMGFRAVEILHRMVTQGVAPTLAELPASRVINTGVDCVTLGHTPWSTTLSDHLTLEAARRAENGRGERIMPTEHPLEVLLIAISMDKEYVFEESVSFEAGSLLGRVIETGNPLVIDPTEDERREDALSCRHAGARTLVALPLQARGSVLGALVLSSERRGACGHDDVSFLVRIADTVAVGVENARLFSRITERTAELELANHQQESMLQTIHELSSPVVPIADGILVMPVIGVMDAQRSSRFIESMLMAISNHRARVVLLDVTGMAMVDATAAHQLVRAARAAALLGAEAVLVGMAPGTAQMMVAQGLDVGSMVARSDLASGFRYALAKTARRTAPRG